MQLKDLSCTGGAGITEVAVPVGGTIFLYLPGGETRAAQVRWTRNTSMGFRFIRPLELETVLMLYRERWSWIPEVAKNEMDSVPSPPAANAA